MKKLSKESEINDYVWRIFPNHLNSRGTAFGGFIISLLDQVAVIIADRHSRQTCVTASIDAVHFLSPIKMGDVLIIQGKVNRSWTSSLEIGMKITAEETISCHRRHVLSAYFTFVALDSQGKPTSVPELILCTEEEKRRFEEAELRRAQRISTTKQKKKN